MPFGSRENNFAIWLLGVGAGAGFTAVAVSLWMGAVPPLVLAWLAVLVSYWLMIAGFYIAKAPIPDELGLQKAEEA